LVLVGIFVEAVLIADGNLIDLRQQIGVKLGFAFVRQIARRS
jgi:hypothetical protein